MGRRPKLPRDYTPWWIPRDSTYMSNEEDRASFQKGLVPQDPMTPVFVELPEDLTLITEAITTSAKLVASAETRRIATPTDNIGAALAWMNSGHNDRMRSSVIE